MATGGSRSEHFLARAAIYLASALALALLVNRLRSQSTAQRLYGVIDNARQKIDGLYDGLDVLNGGLARMQQQVEAFADTAHTREVMPIEIPGVLTKLLENANGWRFRGGSGRWQREAVLPRLASLTVSRVPYPMQILDPRERDLCRRYALYRSKQRPPEVRRSNEGEPSTVLTDILACIYAAGFYRDDSRVDPKIFLLGVYSPLRYDVGAAGLMATVADPDAGALFARHNSWYYKYFVDEFDQTCAELPEVVFPPESDGLFVSKREAVTGSTIRQALEATRIRDPRGGGEGPLLTSWIMTADIFNDVARHIFGEPS